MKRHSKGIYHHVLQVVIVYHLLLLVVGASTVRFVWLVSQEGTAWQNTTGNIRSSRVCGYQNCVFSCLPRHWWLTRDVFRYNKCDKAFPITSRLESHKSRAHRDLLFWCRGEEGTSCCWKMFTRKDILKEHMKIGEQCFGVSWDKFSRSQKLKEGQVRIRTLTRGCEWTP